MDKNSFIDPIKFVNLVDYYFGFLVNVWNFNKISEKTIGQFYYSITFQRPGLYNISIDFENAENYLNITIFTLNKYGQESKWESSNTYHLSQINSLIINRIDSIEYKENNYFFQSYLHTGCLQRHYDNAAKSLRLFLLYYLRIESV